MTLKLLIVDDEALARQRLRDLLSDIQAEFATEVLADASGAQQALDLLLRLQPDVILLDVQMPGTSGVEMARQLKDMPLNSRPDIIFVTAHEDYAVAAFDVSAQDYLLKPVRASRLREAMKRAYERRALLYKSSVEVVTPPTRTFFSVTERNRQLLLPVDHVVFMRAGQKYVSLHTLEKEYLVEESLLALESEFQQQFVRVHRNTLVARTAIAGVERAQIWEGNDGTEPGHDGWCVMLHGVTERLPVSRRQWPMVKAIVRK